MAKLSPIDLQAALKGVDYPADKSALIEAAKSNGASDEIRQELGRLPDRSYETPADVVEAVDFGGSSDG